MTVYDGISRYGRLSGFQMSRNALENRTTRSQTQMRMLRLVQNEKLTFEFDSEIALVGSTQER